MTGCDIFFFVVQDFLKLQSEEGIFRLGNSLKKEKKNVIGKEFKSMTKKELNKRIDQSESDFNNNRYKKTSELLSKYE